MKTIDLATWSRRSQYAFFREMAGPYFNLTAPVDVTRLVEVEKPKGVSMFNAALFAIMGAANACPALRMRFRGEQVVEHAAVHASVTVPIEDDQFAFCDIPFSTRWSEFDAACKAAVGRARRQTELKDHVAHLDDWIYLSCLPWISFTAMTHPTGGRDDCIPRIAWGKMDRHGETWRMPVAIQVHHALVDGLHIGHFFAELEQRLQDGLS